MSKIESKNNLIIEKVKELVCDKLCRYPAETHPDIWEEIQDEVCSHCPLDLLDCIKD